MKTFCVLDLLNLDLKEHNALALSCLSGRSGLRRIIKNQEINRPGLALSGFFDNFGAERIQVFGRGEHSYLQRLDRDDLRDTLRTLFSMDVPCTIFTHALEPMQEFLEVADEAKCPVLQTPLATAEFNGRLIRALSNMFAKSLITHGVLVEVFGIGIFIIGDSGVGKSETALELVHRGHRLVADDAVEVRNIQGNMLLGANANKRLGHHMEIRGLGIINISHLFGVGAIREDKQIQLIVELEPWDSSKNYDRIGVDEKYQTLLDVSVPYLLIPVKPGRNIPIILETAAMNERLKKMGYYSARDFNQKVMDWLETENAKKLYQEKRKLIEAFSKRFMQNDDNSESQEIP
jgi:HPr kinase/phosphorylase